MQFGSSNNVHRKSGFGLHQLRNYCNRADAPLVSENTLLLAQHRSDSLEGLVRRRRGAAIRAGGPRGAMPQAIRSAPAVVDFGSEVSNNSGPTLSSEAVETGTPGIRWL